MSSPDRSSPARRRRFRAGLAATLGAGLAGAAVVPLTGGAVAAEPAAALFDDFSYESNADPDLGGRWTLRSGGGGPGLAGVSWSPDKIGFEDRDDERVMRLEVSSAGAASNTVQAEIYTPERKFREGTYAARVKFTDAPVYGPDGDHVVETFFSITPLRYDYDPDYGELDFEYLPNGGWSAPQAFYVTSWETYRPDPWDALKDYDQINESFAGWHDLVVTNDGAEAVYYIDGVEVGRHYPPNLPKSDQTINFNLWLINDGVLPTGEARAYEQLVDWVYFAQDEVLSPSEVAQQVGGLRAGGVEYQDTVG
ncbi:glycoside hydrolase family 16 protein [Myceligenerans cantabricum]